MLTPGKLVGHLASALGIPLASVDQCNRQLQLAGLRSKAGRGRASANMIPTDAANLLIAAAASERVKDSAQTVEWFRRLVAVPAPERLVEYYENRELVDCASDRWDARLEEETLVGLPAGHTFGEFLDALMAMPLHSRSAPYPGWGAIHFYGPIPSVRVTLEGGFHEKLQQDLFYWDLDHLRTVPVPMKEEEARRKCLEERYDDVRMSKISVRRTIRMPELRKITQALAE